MKSGREKYTRYLLEFGVVFLGVTLAFMFDRIYESYKNSASEKKYLASFYSDISHDVDALDSLLSTSRNTQKLILDITDSLRSTSVDEEDAINLVHNLTIFFRADYVKSTYESVKASGGFSIISDVELRNELVGLYIQYETNSLLEQLYYDYNSEYMFPIVVNEIKFSNRTFVDQNLIKSNRFWNRIFLSTYFINESIKQYEVTRKMCEDVLTRLAPYKESIP